MSHWNYLKESMNKRSWDPIIHIKLVDYILANKKNHDALNLLFSDAKIEEYWADMLTKKDIVIHQLDWVLVQMTHLLLSSSDETWGNEIREKVCTLRFSNEILLCADRCHAIQVNATEWSLITRILTYYELALRVPNIAKGIAKEKLLEKFLQVLFSPTYYDQRSPLNTELIIMCFHRLLLVEQECNGTNTSAKPSKITIKWTKTQWKILFDALKHAAANRVVATIITSTEILRGICYDRRGRTTDQCCPAFLELGLMDIVMKIYKTKDPVCRTSATALLAMFIRNLGDFSYCGEILNTTGLLSELVKEVLSFDHYKCDIPEHLSSALARTKDASQCIWILVEYDFLAVGPILKSMNAFDIISPLLLSKQKLVVDMVNRINRKLVIYLDPEFLNPLRCALPWCTANGKLMKCGRCQLIYYCSVEHQRQHWNSHKIQCSPKTRTEKLRPKNEQRFISTFNGIQLKDTIGDMKKKMDKTISLSTHLWVTDYTITCGVEINKWMTREEFLKLTIEKQLDDLSGVMKQKFEFRAKNDVDYVVSAVINLNCEIQIQVVHMDGRFSK